MRSFQRLVPRAVLVLILVISATSSAQIAPVITVNHGPNALRQQSKPYVILISLDGFRYDYARNCHAKSLLDLAARGASAPGGMIPSYPSVTFPNHYTIVTGLYPGHHGIVANRFYDPVRKEAYSYHDSKSVNDGTWYGGTPLWVLAEQQGMRTASAFWVASEAEIQGAYTSYNTTDEKNYPNDKRVDQVLAWLRLPPEQRPHFITLYFSDVDSAGHQYGPESPELAAAVAKLDREVGRVVSGVKQLNLPVNVIVVADHGMVKVKQPTIVLDQLGWKGSWFERTEEPAMYPKSEADAQRAYDSLQGKSDKFEVYRRGQMPPRYHMNDNPRAGDPIVVATGPYFIPFTDPQEEFNGGSHGYDPLRVPEMKALFVAAGPNIRAGIELPSFENVDVYPFIAKILGLDITHLRTGPIDGNLNVLRRAFKGAPRTH